MRHNLALLLLAALIVPGPALADACDNLAARVVQVTGTQIKARRTHVFDLTWDDN